MMNKLFFFFKAMKNKATVYNFVGAKCLFWFYEGAVVLCYHGNPKKEAKLRTHV